MKVGDLIRWNREGVEGILHMPWFKKRGIILEVDAARVKPSVVTVLWNTDEFELQKIFADELEVISESR